MGREDIAAAKAELRRRVRAALAATTPEQRAAWSAAIVRGIVGSQLWAGARTVLAFAAMADEPDVDGLWGLAAAGSGRRLCVPRVDWGSGTMELVEVSDPARDLVLGVRGVRVPRAGGGGAGAGGAGGAGSVVSAEELDLVLVPGVAFSVSGGRVGRGGGFYDRFLARWAGGARPAVVGVCFGAQVLGGEDGAEGAGDVPMEAHDARVDWVVTEAGVRRCGVAGAG